MITTFNFPAEEDSVCIRKKIVKPIKIAHVTIFMGALCSILS